MFEAFEHFSVLPLTRTYSAVSPSVVVISCLFFELQCSCCYLDLRRWSLVESLDQGLTGPDLLIAGPLFRKKCGAPII